MEIGYLLTHTEHTDTHETTSTRFYFEKESAVKAMNSEFDKMDAILHFPTAANDEDGENYTVKDPDFDVIEVYDGLNSYMWTITPVVPEETPYPIRMTIGDWSGDGHEKAEDYRFWCNKPIEAVREAHFRIKEVTGIDIEHICTGRDGDTVDDATMEKLKGIGFKPDKVLNADNLIGIDDMALIWKLLLQKADPELVFVMAKDPFEPIHFYGPDEKGRRIGSVGYGLFIL